MGTRSPGRGNGVCERRFHVKQGEADHLAGDHLAGNPDIIGGNIAGNVCEPGGQGLRDHGLTAPALAWVMVTTTSARPGPPTGALSMSNDLSHAGIHSSAQSQGSGPTRPPALLPLKPLLSTRFFLARLPSPFILPLLQHPGGRFPPHRRLLKQLSLSVLRPLD